MLLCILFRILPRNVISYQSGPLRGPIRYKHMYVTKPKNSMNIRIGEFMLKKYLFVCGDCEEYAYNEYMLISGMLITRVNCMAQVETVQNIALVRKITSFRLATDLPLSVLFLPTLIRPMSAPDLIENQAGHHPRGLCLVNRRIPVISTPLF